MITNNVTLAMLQESMQNAEANAIKKSHVVGDVIMRFNDKDPGIDYGGTWERTAKGRFPLGSDSENLGEGKYPLITNGENTTGGSADAIVVSHQHDVAIGQAKFGLSGNFDPYSITATTTGKISNAGFAIATPVGESGAGKNIPPYIVFNFWKKIAD